MIHESQDTRAREVETTASEASCAELYKQFPPLILDYSSPFLYGLFVGLPGLIFDVWIRQPLLIINHSI